MQNLYDVGFSSMFAMEAFALADLAEVIGKPDHTVAEIRQRGEAMQDLIRDNLWDGAQTGACSPQFVL